MLLHSVNHRAKEDLRDVTKVVQALLTAGANLEGPPGLSPLDNLLSLTHNIPRYMCKWPTDCFLENQFTLLADLVQLLLKNGAVATLDTQYTHSIIVQTAAEVIKMHYRFGVMGDVSNSGAPYSVIISSLANTLSFLLMTEPKANKSDIKDNFIDGVCFLNAFIFIAGYSSRSGHSKQLIRIILNSLSTAQVISMKQKLSARLVVMGQSAQSTKDVNYVYTNLALKTILGVELPSRLETLACLMVRSALKGKYPEDSMLSSLGLPKHLQHYVKVGYY